MNSLRLVTIFFAADFAAAGQSVYTVIDLATLGGSGATATGVNAKGQAVGIMFDPYGYLHAFSSSSSLGSNATQTEASGINNAGQISGTQFFGGTAYATVWNNGEAITVCGAGSYALAINGSGEVAGMLVNDGQGKAFVTEKGTSIDLGVFEGGSWSSAFALNDQGEVAGYGMTSNEVFAASPGPQATAIPRLARLVGRTATLWRLTSRAQ